MMFDHTPRVQAVYAANATKESVISAGGNPDSGMKVPEIGGTCLNATRKKDAATMPFYVAFDKSGNRK